MVLFLVVAGQRYSGSLVDGVVSIPVSGLVASDEPYLIEVVYYGDANYAKSTGKGNFSVAKFDSSVSVVVGDIKVGETEFVNVTVVGVDGVVPILSLLVRVISVLTSGTLQLT